MKCMTSCARNLPRRRSNTPSSRWRCYRSCWRLAGLWRAGTDGHLAALVEAGGIPVALPRRRLSTPLRALRTSRCIDIAREDRAQSTVEAAFLLPTFLMLILLALQPVCLLYTRAVMESAAAETARLMTTTTAEDDDLKEFTRRRLAAVPNVSIFHAGGPLSWDIELGRAGAGGVSSVSVSSEVKPLPVIGAFAQTMSGAGEGGYVELKVDVSYQSRPEWLEGDYDSWIAAWD